MGQLCVSKQTTDEQPRDDKPSPKVNTKKVDPAAKTADEVVVFTEEKPANGTQIDEQKPGDKQPLINDKDQMPPPVKDQTTRDEPAKPQEGVKDQKTPPSATSKQEPPKKEPAKNEQPTKAVPAASKEPAKKEPAKKEPVKKEPAKKEPAKKEPAKKEPAKKKQPAPKKEKAAKTKKASQPFVSKVDASKRVALESCATAKRVLTGVVQVYNQAYVKDVFIRFTKDAWSTHEDVQAEYVDSHYDVSTDRFSFEIPRDGSPVEFAISYSVDGCQYWDNNEEKNYVCK